MLIGKYFTIEKYNDQKTLLIKVINENNETINKNIAKGTKFKDLLEELNIDTDNCYLQNGLNEPLYDGEIIDISNIYKSKISINTASLDELISLPGIGNSTANKIINYRNTYGYFNYLSEITNVSGIGDKKFEKIKDLICL